MIEGERPERKFLSDSDLTNLLMRHSQSPVKAGELAHIVVNHSTNLAYQDVLWKIWVNVDEQKLKWRTDQLIESSVKIEQPSSNQLRQSP